MTVKPHDDLTAERAADLYSSIRASTDGFDDDQATDDLCVEMLRQALKAARQEALREARDYALACVAERNKQAFELTKTVLNDPRAVWLGCKASEAERIAEWIDRLASEGG